MKSSVLLSLVAISGLALLSSACQPLDGGEDPMETGGGTPVAIMPVTSGGADRREDRNMQEQTNRNAQGSPSGAASRTSTGVTVSGDF